MLVGGTSSAGRENVHGEGESGAGLGCGVPVFGKSRVFKKSAGNANVGKHDPVKVARRMCADIGVGDPPGCSMRVS